MSFWELGIEICKKVFNLYFKTHGSKETIKYNSGNNERQDKIVELNNTNNAVKWVIHDVEKDIYDLEKEINDNSKSLEGLTSCLLHILTYLSEYLNALISKSVRNEFGKDSSAKDGYGENITVITVRSVQNEYDSIKQIDALLETAQWIIKNKSQYLTDADKRWFEAVIEKLNKRKKVEMAKKQHKVVRVSQG